MSEILVAFFLLINQNISFYVRYPTQRLNSRLPNNLIRLTIAFISYNKTKLVNISILNEFFPIKVHPRQGS